MRKKISPESELMKVIVFFACFKFSACYSSNEVNTEYKPSKLTGLFQGAGKSTLSFMGWEEAP